MNQGANILEKLSIINEALENLKSEVEDISFSERTGKIQKYLEQMQNMLPKQIYQFNITDFEGYINWMSQIEKRVLELKNDFKNISFKLDFIIEEIAICKVKAEKRFKEKKTKNKILKKY